MYMRGTPKRLPVLIAGRADRGDVRQGDPWLHAPEVAARIRIFGDDDVEHLEQVGHRPGEGHHHIHGRGQRPVAAYRDHSA
jgi:hypothetical protein